jgi:hypothetical protein
LHSHPDGGETTEASDADKNIAGHTPKGKHAIYHPNSEKLYEYNTKGIFNHLPANNNADIFNYINRYAH